MNNLCFRSLYAIYNQTKYMIDNIKVMGFAPDEYFYANSSVNPDNAGFCPQDGPCLPAGLLNLTDCVQGLICKHLKTR